MRMLMWTLPVVVWAFVLALLVAGYGSLLLQWSYLFIPVLAAATGAAIVFCKRAELWRYLVSGWVIAGCFIAYFLITTVSFRNEIVGRDIDGTVTKVERSHNHDYAVVEVKNEDGSVMRLEGVSEGFYGVAHRGQKFRKDRGSITGVLDGKTVQVVGISGLDILRPGIR